MLDVETVALCDEAASYNQLSSVRQSVFALAVLIFCLSMMNLVPISWTHVAPLLVLSSPVQQHCVSSCPPLIL